MTQPNTGFANSGDAKVAYESLGDGKAVVFNGRSLLDESSFSNHQDVIAVLDHLGIDRVVVVGCSMGGGTAFDLALAAPDRVSGLVLIGTDSPGFEPEEYEPPQWPELVKAYKTGDLARMAELEAEIWVLGHDRSLDAVDRTVFDLVVEMDLPLLATEKRREETS